MVLAAGRGERMRPLSDSTPKPLLLAGGKPLIGYLLASLARAGIRDIVINLSWLGERIRDSLRDGAELGVRISYIEEGPIPLETGGGIVNALPLLGSDPFIVVSGDIWTDFDFLSLHVAAQADAQVVLVANPAHHLRGDFALEGDRVVAREQDRLTYANIGLFRREMFSGYAVGRFPLVQVLQRSIAAGRLRGQVHRGEWMNIGTAQQLAALDARLRGGGTRATG
ncbi:MAG TPA: nucleotidyltransferase family protein [Steroidobacteraceae bacterium]|nr:nucleotidyltransferase family protein [Steroidobacteraceae bacterium]